MATRELVLSALFAAIIVVLGLLPPIMLAVFPVPITAQILGVMLAGLVLGAKRGGFAVILFLILVAVGLPVLSGSRGGLATFVSPTAGYLVGFFFAAVTTGYIAEQFSGLTHRGMLQTFGFFIAALTGAVLVDHGLGILWLAYGIGIGLGPAIMGDLVFIPADMLKALLAAVVARVVVIGYPLLPQRGDLRG